MNTSLYGVDPKGKKVAITLIYKTTKRKEVVTYMAKKKNSELVRVSINLPISIIEKVKKYGEKLGVNATSAYILLLNKAIEQEEMMSNLPAMLLAMEELKKIVPPESK